MLKSTHKPTGGPAPLPEGWTEHKAPTGHAYYYNSTTKQSTYTRPAVTVIAPPPVPSNPSESFLQYQSTGSAIPGSWQNFNGIGPSGQHQGAARGGFYGHRGGRGGNERSRDSRPQPTDKPKSRHPIPGCEPWVLVHTKFGRRFAYNTDKNQSFWRIPDKLKDGILQLDQLRIKEKAEALQKAKEPQSTGEAPGAPERPITAAQAGNSNADEGEDSSEYEEIEVTDDEGEDEDGENPSKRQRIDEDVPDGPVEFNEDDIAYQLAAMGQDYGLDPGEYDDGNMEEWEEGAEGLELSEEDAIALFKDLLNDAGINPFSPWEKLVEEGKLIDDTRYTALTTMKARKEAWDDWSRERMKYLKEIRAKEEKKDPRIPYLSFLQKNATPKLYWPEFKRKFKKDSVMKDSALSDKDRERYYREHIKRLQLPQSTLKSDLSALLKSQPLLLLNNTTSISRLPPSVLADIRYISLDATTRDPYIKAFVSTLNPPPETVEEEESEEAIKARKDKERRQKALDDRKKRVADEKRKQQRDLEFGKGRLKHQEAEIERAMRVSKKGLKDHLMEENDGS